MQRDLQRPITCLITSGETTSATTNESDKFLALLSLVRSAIAARVALVQLREFTFTGAPFAGTSFRPLAWSALLRRR